MTEMELQAKSRLLAAKEYSDYEDWAGACMKAYPEHAAQMQFKGRVEHGEDTISAEVRGVDKVFGVWTGDENGSGIVFDPKD